MRLAELCELAPDDQRAPRMMASCHIELGHLAEAEAMIAPWLTGKEIDPEAALLGGRLRAAQGRDEEALALLEWARTGAGERLSVLLTVGSLHLTRDRLPEAAATFEQALAIDPENASARTGLGVTWQRLGRNEDAAEQLMRSIALMHRQSFAHHHLGLALLALGHFEWALRAFTVSLSFNEANPEAHEKLAEIYGRLDQRAVSDQHARAAMGWRRRLAGRK